LLSDKSVLHSQFGVLQRRLGMRSLHMSHVFLYGFRAKFIGGAAYDYNHPELNAVHDCLLFLARQGSETDFAAAINEIHKYGFAEVENLHGGLLRVEVLNTEQYKGFAGFYEEALREGSSLVFYPQS